MKTLIKSVIVICIAFLTNYNSSAQTKNLMTVDVKVFGNCGMCKKTIEKAANVKGKSNAVWDADLAMAKITKLALSRGKHYTAFFHIKVVSIRQTHYKIVHANFFGCFEYGFSCYGGVVKCNVVVNGIRKQENILQNNGNFGPQTV